MMEIQAINEQIKYHSEILKNFVRKRRGMVLKDENGRVLERYCSECGKVSQLTQMIGNQDISGCCYEHIPCY